MCVGTEKRERQKANRQQRLEAAKKQEQRAGMRQRLILGGVIAAVLLAGLYLLSLGGDDETAGTEAPELNTTTTPEITTECPEEDGSSPRTIEFDGPPPLCIDPATIYNAEVVTSRGTFTIELDPSQAEQTVNNFVTLARYHYYDGVPFHRIIPGFVVQGGDALGAEGTVPIGTGNPGYQIPDELPEEGQYEVGSVAMANSGPNTNGSQFFVVTGEQGVALPPQYSLFGTVTDGLDAVSDIESTGSETGEPLEETVIESITITEG